MFFKIFKAENLTTTLMIMTSTTSMLVVMMMMQIMMLMKMMKLKRKALEVGWDSAFLTLNNSLCLEKEEQDDDVDDDVRG